MCLGNICRSPLAEAALRAEAAARGLDLIVDSAGTADWHSGKAPDPRAQAVAQRHGIDISGYGARQVRAEDFHRFDYVVALDGQNLRDLHRIKPAGAAAKLGLLFDFVPGRSGEAVADPYYGDDAGFDVTWAEVTAGARGIADAIQTSG